MSPTRSPGQPSSFCASVANLLSVVIGMRQATMVGRNERTVVHSCECANCRQHPYGQTAKEHRRINRLVASADERNRRLLVGFLAQQQGRGGIALLARVTGLSRN